MPFSTAERGIDRALAMAQVAGAEWVFIDTSPTMWVVVQEAIRAATLVLIPARPGFLDLDAVRETVKTARERNKPYAVVLNACPVKRDEREAPAVAQSRAYLDREGVPVFAGQISHRAAFSLTLAAGASAGEAEPTSLAAAEIAKLWSAVEKSVAAINAAYADAAADLGPEPRAGGVAYPTLAVATSPPRRASPAPSRLSGRGYGARSPRAHRCARTSRCRPRIPIPSMR